LPPLPFHQRERKAADVRTILTSNDVMGGPSTFTMLYTRAKFHDDNPKVTAAFLKALEEAIAFINADKRAAAQTFLDMEGQGLKLDEVLKFNDPDVRYTTSPESPHEVRRLHGHRRQHQDAPRAMAGHVLPGHPRRTRQLKQ
jgi:NitT/TauT family transport system substrate-binding protein